jgi:hypothetical protein
MPSQLRAVYYRKAEESQHDTGLRFTDILFGFVISQIFLRLQHWASLSGFSRWQLLCSSALVLGSWIGFRRSLNRHEYELKFFNLPLFRFLLDQMMLIFYFRVATLTPLNPSKPVDVSSVTHSTLKALLFVFGLYLLWDISGQLMAVRKDKNGDQKYPESTIDFKGFAITLFFLVVFAALLHILDSASNPDATLILIVATVFLIVYRWAKDARSARKQLDSAPASPRGAADRASA